MIIKVEVRGYNDKLVWKTMQKNLLYPGQMYKNKEKALQELKERLNAFTIPIEGYPGNHENEQLITQ